MFTRIRLPSYSGASSPRGVTGLLLASRPTPMLKDPLLDVCNFSFSIFTVILLIWRPPASFLLRKFHTMTEPNNHAPLFVLYFNHSKPSSYIMYHQVLHLKILYSVYTVHFRVVLRDKQQLLSYTDFYNRDSVFTL